MKKIRNSKEVQEIYHVLDFYLRKTTLGLLPFMNRNVPPPSSLEIATVLKTKNISTDLGVKIAQGRPLPEQQQVIELAEPYTGIIEKYGGLEDIRKSFENWGHSNPDGYNMLRDWSQKGKIGLRTMADIADHNGYNHSSTPYKLRYIYLEEIALDIFMQFMSKQSN